MSHLLAISVGPVQEFIAAARRTRDLWFGSYLLSEISRAVARAVECESRLIFPVSSDAENVANVILTKLDGDPKVIAVKAKEAAKTEWKEFAKRARKEASSIIRDRIWEDQEDDVIEFYAAWVIHLDPNNYREDRARVMRLLAGRKNCRDFESAEGRFGVPKSSLDGQRETVLKDGKRTDWANNLRLSAGEQLDVVGVTKRLGTKKGESHPRYSSVARVAVETWLCGVKDQVGFKELSDACATVPGLNKVAEPNYGDFPYEGTVAFKERHTDLIAELGEGVREPLKRVANALSKFEGEPTPYVAVLVADGDGMGAELSKLSSVEAHQALSKKLATFADGAKDIVTKHSGVLIYAGGDDVLAFVPLHTCLKCARALRDRFRQTTEMTLSVGVAIGHFMENLEDLRDYGQQAEKAAKAVEGKDALAVHLHKRGGSPVRVCGQWCGESPLDMRLQRLAKLIYDDAIPGKLPYDLYKLAELYKGWRWQIQDETTAEAMRQDTLRVIQDKQPLAGRQYMPEIEAIVKTLTGADGLEQFAEQLLVARLIATALKQSGEGS